MLDNGVDTRVLASVQPIPSDFEELRGSFAAVHKVVEEWRREHGGKPIKIVVAPDLASQPAFDALRLDHFERTVPAATAPGQSATGIISLHGLPVSLIDSDSWSPRVKLATNRLKPQLAAILRRKGYADVEVAAAPDGFADKLEDPDNKLSPVSELFARAEREKRDLVIALPIEFLAENTDTLFAHAALMCDGVPGYQLYQGPPSDIDWCQPFVRRFKKRKTEFIHAGAPGGTHQLHRRRRPSFQPHLYRSLLPHGHQPGDGPITKGRMVRSCRQGHRRPRPTTADGVTR